MGTTPIGLVTAAGFVRQDFPYVLNYEQANVRAIYGQDTYLGADCQDGQLVVLEAQGVYDTSGVALAVFNAFSPATAIGTGLDRVIKINGIRRKRASYSNAPLTIVGRAGLTITDGSIADPAGNIWAFPPSVQIASTGQVTTTITCQTLGAVALSAGGIDTANGAGAFSTDTLQQGLQSAITIAAASVGLPVESDSALRQRQAVSTSLPSLRLDDGLAGALAAISGVNRLKVYDNTKGYRDVNGIPGHCLAVVVDGGDAATVAQVIELKKGPGVSTYGSTIETVTPTTGPQQQVGFFYVSDVPVSYAVTVQSLGGYTQAIEDAWKASLAAFVNGLDIGEDVERDQAFTAAKLYDGLGSKTFKIVDAGFRQSRGGATPALADVPIAFFEAATCDVSNIAVTVIPQGS